MFQLPELLLQRPDLAVPSGPFLVLIALLVVGFALALSVRN